MKFNLITCDFDCTTMIDDHINTDTKNWQILIKRNVNNKIINNKCSYNVHVCGPKSEPYDSGTTTLICDINYAIPR